MSIKVLLVDDHPMLRTGLRQTIVQYAHLSVVGEASNAAQAVGRVKELTPELIVMDIHLPDLSGIEVIRQIIELLPSVKILVFSGDVTRSLVDEALQAGAHGYVYKQNAIEELIQAIEMIMAGKLFLSPQVSAGILEDYRNSLLQSPKQPQSSLSPKEVQLLRLVAEGRRNKEIAVQLGVSPKSVEAYRSRLMKKLGYSSPAELVRYAIREGIAPA